MIKRILSYLLHHANRETKAEGFYKIKDKILSRYGTVVGYDVQFIEGKKCNSCGGLGYHNKYSWPSGEVYDTADCYHCWGGWYKHPTWVLLQRIQFGKYIFHKPIQRERRLKNPFLKECGWRVSDGIIEGYIEHSRTEFGRDALIILYLLYDWRGYWKRWYKTIGRSWYYRWWKPTYWVNTIAHIIRYKHKAIPFRRMKKWVPPPVQPVQQTEDLPF